MTTATRAAVRNRVLDHIDAREGLDLVEFLRAAMSPVLANPQHVHGNRRLTSPTRAPDSHYSAFAVVARNQRWNPGHIILTREPACSFYRNYLELKIDALTRYTDIPEINPDSR
jgi:hypothetical protein